MNPGFAGAAYGFAGMGPYGGGQAEYLRVPHGFLIVEITGRRVKTKRLCDVIGCFPTGYHATELAGVKPGDSVVIYSGPVGLMAAHSASIRGQ
jgi:threonine dehydrogenase-like Zn-dependent dehydrogenase